MFASAPGRGTTPRHGHPLGLGGDVVHGGLIVVTKRREFLQRRAAVVRRIIDGSLFEPFRLGRAQRGPGLVHRPSGERLVRDQLRAGLFADPAGGAEVIRMRMRHDDGVDVLDPIARRGETSLQRLPARRSREAGVDNGEATVVHQAVHVHVPEPGHPDGELHPQDTGGDLGDLFGRLFLLLFRRPGRLGVTRPTRRVSHARIVLAGSSWSYGPGGSARLGARGELGPGTHRFEDGAGGQAEFVFEPASHDLQTAGHAAHQ